MPGIGDPGWVVVAGGGCCTRGERVGGAALPEMLKRRIVIDHGFPKSPRAASALPGASCDTERGQ